MVDFYYEYRDKNGHLHRTVAKWQRSNGLVWTMQDYLFNT